MNRDRGGRPRTCQSELLWNVVNEWAQSGARTFTIPELVVAIMARSRCSRRTAYRAIHRACDEGVLRLPGFGTWHSRSLA